MKTKLPAHPEAMKRWTKRFQTPDHVQFFSRIPPMFAFECKAVLVSYYGSYFKAAWAMFRDGLYFGWHHVLGFIQFDILSDRVFRFTEVRPLVPNEPKTARRHRRGCSPNCNNPFCMDAALPKWFKWLIRYDKI